MFFQCFTLKNREGLLYFLLRNDKEEDVVLDSMASTAHIAIVRIYTQSCSGSTLALVLKYIASSLLAV